MKTLIFLLDFYYYSGKTMLHINVIIQFSYETQSRKYKTNVRFREMSPTFLETLEKNYTLHE